MRRARVPFFHELGTQVAGCVVIVDIDGTLTCLSHDTLRADVVAVLRRLQATNDVFAFSNNFDRARSRRIAAAAGVAYIASRRRKPRPAVLRALPEYSRNKPVVFIGDKYLTDELCAVATRSRYVRVRRYTCVTDSFMARAGCAIDSFARLLCGWCVRARR